MGDLLLRAGPHGPGSGLVRGAGIEPAGCWHILSPLGARSLLYIQTLATALPRRAYVLMPGFEPGASGL